MLSDVRALFDAEIDDHPETSIRTSSTADIVSVLHLSSLLLSCNTEILLHYRVKNGLFCHHWKSTEPSKVSMNLKVFHLSNGLLSVRKRSTIMLKRSIWKLGLFWLRRTFVRDCSPKLETF